MDLRYSRLPQSHDLARGFAPRLGLRASIGECEPLLVKITPRLIALKSDIERLGHVGGAEITARAVGDGERSIFGAIIVG